MPARPVDARVQKAHDEGRRRAPIRDVTDRRSMPEAEPARGLAGAVAARHRPSDAW
jgi:hypothetical protein